MKQYTDILGTKISACDNEKLNCIVAKNIESIGMILEHINGFCSYVAENKNNSSLLPEMRELSGIIEESLAKMNSCATRCRDMFISANDAGEILAAMERYKKIKAHFAHVFVDILSFIEIARSGHICPSSHAYEMRRKVNEIFGDS